MTPDHDRDQTGPDYREPPGVAGVTAGPVANASGTPAPVPAPLAHSQSSEPLESDQVMPGPVPPGLLMPGPLVPDRALVALTLLLVAVLVLVVVGSLVTSHTPALRRVQVPSVARA